MNKLATANFRSTSLIHFGWLTTNYPCKQASHDQFPSVERVVLVCVFSAFNLASQFCQLLSNYGVQMVLLLIIIRKTVLETSLNDFYTCLHLHLSVQLTMFDAPNMLRLIIHSLTHQRRVFFYLFFLKCVDILLVNSHILQQQQQQQQHLPAKFICRHFGIDCLVHFCGTV